MAKDTPWREAIEDVLREAGTALHYTEIAERIVTSGLRKKVGATPAATVNSILTTSINKEGEASPFIKLGKGEYALKPGTRAELPTVGGTQSAEDEEEEQYSIITSFGMYWRRDFVKWSAEPRLLGIQQIGASPVNFCKQIGLYLLYDGREAIYVGRAVERPLGRRLYEHTVDRLSTRWDRFSWFGLLPVSDQGNLGDLPQEYVSTRVIPAIEAVLIEALEPRQNRKRGDDFAAVEYMQQEDPDIEAAKIKEKIKEIVERALTKKTS